MSSGAGRSLERLYQALTHQKVGARFFKCELHVHTPASERDFRFPVFGPIPLEREKIPLFEKVSTSEVEYIASLSGLNFSKGKDREHDKTWRWKLACRLIADQAFQSGVEIMAVTDHNTADGYAVLKKAVLEVKTHKSYSHSITVLPGVEMEVLEEKVHLIGIVNADKESSLKKFLEVAAFYRGEKRPLNIEQARTELRALGALVYFPHINTAPLTKDKNRIIYSSCDTDAVGVSDPERLNKTLDRCRTFVGARSLPVRVIVDSDAHYAQGIGKLPLWLKLDGPTAHEDNSKLADWISVLRYALRQDDRVTSNIPLRKAAPRIIGLAAHGTPLGKVDGWFYLRFSDQMNCLTGPRGTGKSTLLKLIKLATTGLIDSDRETPSDRCRDLLNTRKWYQGNFERVVLFGSVTRKEVSTDVAIEILPPQYNQENDRLKAKEFTFNEHLLQDASSWIIVYYYEGGVFKRANGSTRAQIMQALRGTTMSQTEIETLASSPSRLYTYFKGLMHRSSSPLQKSLQNAEKTRDIAKDQLIRQMDLHQRRNLSPEAMRAHLRHLQGFHLRWIEASEEIAKIEQRMMDRLNTALEGKSHLSFISDEPVYHERRFRDWYRHRIGDARSDFDVHVWGEMEVILIRDVLSGLLITAHETPERLLKRYPQIQEYTTATEEEVDENDMNRSFYSRHEVANRMVELATETLQYQTLGLKNFLSSAHAIELRHNVLVRRGFKNDAEPEFTSIECLSLGQRCVAVMDMIIEASRVMNVKGPFMSDQPEDHQDNRYIFDHLVQDLRDLKSTRQVIISTHNANIPVGADAELIMVMESDGKRLWPEYQGSIDRTDEYEMKAHVQTTLEGGRKAFEKRITTYGYVV